MWTHEKGPLMNLEIRPLQQYDIPAIVAAFAALGWSGKDTTQYQNYFAEREAGKRVTPVAFLEGRFAGYLNVIWESGYAPFREAHIPEIGDFNVLPEFQRRGVGSRLMVEAERMAGERSLIVGIGVGMTADYGNAQRMYVKRGYIPDGRGLTSQDRFLSWGDMVRVDDGLVLWFTKRLEVPTP